MLKVRNFLVRFAYEYDKKKNVKATLAIIEKYEDIIKDEKTGEDHPVSHLISAGRAQCHTYDKIVGMYSKDVGRKIALKRALENHDNFNGWENKKVRSEVWEAYRTMTKVPRWGNKIVE